MEFESQTLRVYTYQQIILKGLKLPEKSFEVIPKKHVLNLLCSQNTVDACFLNYTKAKSILFGIQRSRKHIAFKMTSQHKFVQHHLWTYIYTDNILFAYCSKVNSCSSFLSETKNKKFFSP